MSHKISRLVKNIVIPTNLVRDFYEVQSVRLTNKVPIFLFHHFIPLCFFIFNFGPGSLLINCSKRRDPT